MARDLPSGMAAAIAAKNVNVAIFCELDWPSAPVRVWSGIGSFTFDGKTFTGLGDLGSITPVQESSDGRANGLTVTLSGIPTDIVAATLDEYYQGRDANIWVGCLTDSGALVSTLPYLQFAGKMDVGSYSADGATASIAITIEGEMIILQQANGRRRTHEDQQLDYPGDLGFEFVVSANSEQVDNWGQPGNSIPSKMHGASRQTY
jgi:hypothetical protein